MNMRSGLPCLLMLLAALGVSACGPSVKTDGEDSIFMLAARGDFGPVRKAIQEGFDVNSQDQDGRTLLHYAVAAGQVSLFEYLIVQYRADPRIADADGLTAVDMANKTQNPEILKILQDEGIV